MAVRNPNEVPREDDGIDYGDSPLMLGGNRTSDPAPYSNRVQIYPKRDADGFLDAYMRDERGRVVRLTRRGGLSTNLINVKDCGAVGDGETDDLVPINEAINRATELEGEIYFPPGTYKTSSTLSFGAGTTIRGSNPYTTTILRAFDGDLVEMGGACNLSDIQLDGDSTNYSGRLVYVSNGIAQGISNCWFTDFAGGDGEYAIEFDHGQGSLSYINACFFYPASPYVVAIKFPTAAEGAIPRNILHCQGGGSILVDFGGSSDALVSDCFTNGFVFSEDTNLAFISNCRVATALNTTTIKGGAVTIVNAQFAGPVIFDSTTENCLFTNCSAPDWDITDAGSGNQIDHGARLYTPAWTGSVSNPAIGNGSIVGTYSRRGNMITAMIEITIGNTTTFGTGYWLISLPQAVVNANPIHAGYGYVICNGTGRIANPVPLPGTSTAMIQAVNSSAGVGPATASFPDTWVAGDVIRITVPYRVN